MMSSRKSGELILVAVEDSRIVGMIELHGFDQIALLFAESAGRGIGRRLVEEALKICRTLAPRGARLQVHASRYAVPFYRKLGFAEKGAEQTENGITYLPVELEYGVGA